MGIISAKGRSTGVGDGSYEDFLQTDAPINHGNSGGALVEHEGRARRHQLADPLELGRQHRDRLRDSVEHGAATSWTSSAQNGKVTRAQLGVTVQPVTSDMAASLGLKQVDGAIVSSVDAGQRGRPGGPEARRRHRVVQRPAGARHQHAAQPRRRGAARLDGDAGGRCATAASSTLTVKLDEASAQRSDARRRAPSPATTRRRSAWRSAPLTPELADALGAPKDAHGLVVEDVDPDGRAADAGMQPGDVIEEVNRQPVRTVDELRAAVRSGATSRCCCWSTGRATTSS